MHQARSILSFLGSTVLIVALTAFAYIYANPYSLHRVITVSYDGFDTAPASDGSVFFDSQQVSINFSLPYLRFSDATINEIREAIGERPLDDFDTMTRCVQLVRSRLNARDRLKPKAATADAEQLYRSGTDLFCLCSEHAILLNEVLQVFQLQSRVLWLEGHVVAEYFDKQRNSWIFVDPHTNVLFVDPQGTPMSAAELIFSTEHKPNAVPTPICSETEPSHSLQYSEMNQLRYRNVLLNGECYALSGTTLHDPSRWTHVARFLQRPQMLVLASNYDTSHAKYIEPFRLDAFILLCVAFVTAYNTLWRFPRRPRLRKQDV